MKRSVTAVLVMVALVFVAAIASAKMVPTISGLKYEDTKVGTGDEAVPGKMVTVHYTGWLWVNEAKGKKFDSSVDKGKPYSFKLGAGNVIKGCYEFFVVI